MKEGFFRKHQKWVNTGDGGKECAKEKGSKELASPFCCFDVTGADSEPLSRGGAGRGCRIVI
jgi:hypothetical protein